MQRQPSEGFAARQKLYGRAGKAQMQHAMLRELHLATLPEPPDVADALAVALCHYYATKIARIA